MEQHIRTLEEQRIEFANRKFLATPLAGLIVTDLYFDDHYFKEQKINIKLWRSY